MKLKCKESGEHRYEACDNCKIDFCAFHLIHIDTIFHAQNKILESFRFCSGLCIVIWILSQIIDRFDQFEDSLNVAWIPVMRNLRDEMKKASQELQKRGKIDEI